MMELVLVKRVNRDSDEEIEEVECSHKRRVVCGIDNRWWLMTSPTNNNENISMEVQGGLGTELQFKSLLTLYKHKIPELCSCLRYGQIRNIWFI